MRCGETSRGRTYEGAKRSDAASRLASVIRIGCIFCHTITEYEIRYRLGNVVQDAKHATTQLGLLLQLTVRPQTCAVDAEAFLSTANLKS